MSWSLAPANHHKVKAILIRYRWLCLAAGAALAASAAQAAPGCKLDQAQRELGQGAGQDSQTLRLLDDCAAAGVRDYRIPMLRGVIARNQGQLDQAAALLQTAHEQAPAELSPALELAVTEEWRNHPQAAGALYTEILRRDPNSRPALLGLARVDRAENRLAAAQAIYTQLHQANPQDAEANNGLGWVALANKQFPAARENFAGVLAANPKNTEAQTGLTQLAQANRYQLDITGGATHTNAGTAAQAGIDFQAQLDAFNTIEIANIYNSSELPAAQLATQTQLPTDDVRLGYYYHVPHGVNLSVTYDYRAHTSQPAEHWLTLGAGTWVNNRVQLFAGARAAFGAPKWNNLLLNTGAIVSLTPAWQLGGTLYFDTADYGHGTHTSYNRNNYAFAGDIYRQGPGNLFINAGMGYSPDLSNLEEHARIVLPVTRNNALLLSVEHVSNNQETLATIGWRFLWQ